MASGFSGTATGWLAQCLLAVFSLFVATGMLLGAGGYRSPMTSSVA
jgi:hypothetical protein